MYLRELYKSLVSLHSHKHDSINAHEPTSLTNKADYHEVKCLYAATIHFMKRFATFSQISRACAHFHVILNMEITELPLVPVLR